MDLSGLFVVAMFAVGMGFAFFVADPIAAVVPQGAPPLPLAATT